MEPNAWKGLVLVKEIVQVEPVADDVVRRKLCFRVMTDARCGCTGSEQGGQAAVGDGGAAHAPTGAL